MEDRSLNNERGAILVVALIFVCILAIAGTMSYKMTSSELMIAKNFSSSREALYSANAGLEEARAALGLPTTDPPGINSNAIYDPATAYPDPLWTAYILTSASWQTSDDPNYSGSDTNYFPNSSSQTNTTITANSLQSDLSYWVKMQHKREYDAEQEGHTTSTPLYDDNDGSMGVHTAASPGNIIFYGYPDTSNPIAQAFTTSDDTEYKPIDIITSYFPGDSVSGKKGGSTIRTEVVHDPGPPILAALYAEYEVDGDTTSYPVTISGIDNCAISATTPYCSLCGVAPDRNYDVYFYPSTGDARIDDSDVNPSGISFSINYGDINLNVNQGITTLKVWETSTTPSDCYNSDYKICSSEGDLTVTSQTGTGILLVQGNLTLEDTDWNGLILVTGELTLNGGPNNITIEGAVLVNGEVWINPSDSSYPSPNPGPVTINYNSCAIDAALSSIPLRILKWTDLSMMP